MRSLYDFLVEPVNGRYNNVKKIAGVDVYVNTKIESYKHVNRVAKVNEIPLNEHFGINKGDEVILHQNVFRRFYDIRGKEKNSRSYLPFENLYMAAPDQVYAKRSQGGDWEGVRDYVFVSPIKDTNEYNTSQEKPLYGVLKIGNDSFDAKVGEVVSFTPDSEFEFVFNDSLMYCMKFNDIVAIHGDKRKEEEYRPSWVRSSR